LFATIFDFFNQPIFPR